MSVRRLADDHLQPASFAFNRKNELDAKKWIKKYPKGREASAVIPLLWLAQEQEGWVSKPAIEYMAERLDMPFIRVLEVATFYTMFQLKPVGKKAHIQVCGTTPCMLRGAEDLKNVCRKKISSNQFDVTQDGNLSWEEVECAGACVNAPMVQIFSDTYEDLTPELLEEIIDKFAAGQGNQIKPGPQNGRHFSMPLGGATTLTDETIYATRVQKSTSQSTLKKSSKSLTNKVKTKPETKKSSKSSGPERLKKPQGVADDLKMISGVGPKLEKTLNQLGFFHFSQIAKWKKADIAIVDDELSFKGRIERDDWIRQAKALAKGGRDEYVKIFGKEPR